MSYTRFGDDLPPPDGYDVKKCDLCVNTAYILQQTYDFATNMFKCSSGTRRIHAEISPEVNTIGKINGYTRSALRFGVDWPNISSNLRGGICKCIFCFNLFMQVLITSNTYYFHFIGYVMGVS